MFTTDCQSDLWGLMAVWLWAGIPDKQEPMSRLPLPKLSILVSSPTSHTTACKWTEFSDMTPFRADLSIPPQCLRTKDPTCRDCRRHGQGEEAHASQQPPRRKEKKLPSGSDSFFIKPISFSTWVTSEKFYRSSVIIHICRFWQVFSRLILI